MFYKDDLHNQKGEYGEGLVKDLLLEKGCKLIEEHKDEGHLIDFLFLGTHFPPLQFYAEVKTKEHRNYYPDIGINKNAHKGYLKMQKSHPVYLFIVDASAGWIYGNDLSYLDKVESFYPLEDKICVYYPLSKMIKYRQLTGKEIKELKDLSFEG